jgi:hypothetical protein
MTVRCLEINVGSIFEMEVTETRIAVLICELLFALLYVAVS